MNREEADQLLQRELDEFEALGFVTLAQRVGEVVARDVPRSAGTTYQLELQIFWDDRPGGPLRLLGSVDDGGLRSFVPLTSSRIVKPPEAPEEPVFPLTVMLSDTDQVVLQSSGDAETELEFFDSANPNEPVKVIDALGRPVHLVVFGLEVVTCRLA